MGAGSGERYQPCREAASVHAKGREQLIHSPRKVSRAFRPLGGQRSAGAREVGGGRFALLGDVAQVQVRGVEQLELTGGPSARREHVGKRRAVLLGEAKQYVAPLLGGAAPLGIALDGR